MTSDVGYFGIAKDYFCKMLVLFIKRREKRQKLTVEEKMIKRKQLFVAAQLVLLIIFIVNGLIEAVWQYQDSQYVRQVAEKIIEEARATDNRAKIISLRDYLRANVSFYNARPINNDAPFLRATASETLQTGKGFCGEVSRAFINLANAVGVKAQRINLDGRPSHVVAEAEIAPGQFVIVDSQNPPHIVELETLDQVILRPEFDDYSTLNLRRLNINWLVSRLKLQMGPVVYWTENPHALKSLFSFGLAFLLTLFKVTKLLLRTLMRRWGWIHISTLAVREAPKQTFVSG